MKTNPTTIAIQRAVQPLLPKFRVVVEYTLPPPEDGDLHDCVIHFRSDAIAKVRLTPGFPPQLAGHVAGYLVRGVRQIQTQAAQPPTEEEDE